MASRARLMITIIVIVCLAACGCDARHWGTGANTTKQKISTSENESTEISSNQIYLQQRIDQIKGKRQRRSVMGIAARENITEKEAMDSEGTSLEDIGAMDYADPHRNPPIHNHKH